MTVDEEEARNISGKQIQFLQKEDPFFELLKEADVGNPILVKNVRKQPSYWLVPLLKESRMTGFVRVLLNGSVAQLGRYNQNPTKSADDRAEITEISGSEASRVAEQRIRKELGESGTEPVFVHDGPIGREAWLVEVTRDSKPIRWIFVTNGQVYERSAGKLSMESRSSLCHL